jgi:hypothetical protein
LTDDDAPHHADRQPVMTRSLVTMLRRLMRQRLHSERRITRIPVGGYTVPAESIHARQAVHHAQAETRYAAV